MKAITLRIQKFSRPGVILLTTVVAIICTNGGDLGVGQVSLLHIPSTGMQWVGLESTAPAAITSGFSATATHIVWINNGHTVDIQSASVDTIIIHNGSAGTRAGNLTLVW